MQYRNPHYHLSSGWAPLVTAHAVSGPGIIKALKEAATGTNAGGCVLVVEMSSENNLAVSDYVQSAVQIAEDNSDFVVGIVCQRKLSDKMIHMTPGKKKWVGSVVLWVCLLSFLVYLCTNINSHKND